MSAVGCQLSLDVHLGRSHLKHSLKVLLGLRNVLEVVEIIGLGHSAKHLSDHLAVVHPLFNERLDRGLLWLWGRHRLDGGLAAGGALGIRNIRRLALASLGGLLSSSNRGATSAAVVIVDSLHVVSQIPLAGETAARN